MFGPHLRKRTRPAGALVSFVAALMVAAGAPALRADTIVEPVGPVVSGRVLDQAGLGVPGATLTLSGGPLTTPLTTVSDPADGSFRFEDVPGAGTYLLATGDGTPFRGRLTLQVGDDGLQGIEFRLQIGFSDEVTVTETREAQLRRETPASIGVVSAETLERIKPSHPGQVMGLMAGVLVNQTSGEGHATAIRQPITTNAVYLYLEDGVPSRSTGFFNHNALYELNVPGAASLEVTKGPGSALYGSDAIGGVINVVTKSALGRPGFTVDAEGGEYGWRRLLAGGNVGSDTQGVRGDVNLTHSDGWRDSTNYDRVGGTFRWDRAWGSGSYLKALVSGSHIDQQTAGSSTLSEADYLTNPTRNLTPVSYRQVQALRVSTEYASASSGALWNVIPYLRYNSMEILPNWSLTYDPTVYTTKNTSFGALAKIRRDVGAWRTQVIGGLDVDVSPGSRVELSIKPGTETTPDGRRIFVSYTPTGTIYDYDVTFAAVAPYVQVETSPIPRLRLSGGLRFDWMRYDYQDLLDTPPTSRYKRPGDTVRHFSAVSPKLGATYEITDRVSVFGAFRHAFRAPAESQLFRQGSAANTVDLDPVKANNVEGGASFSLSGRVSIDGSAYRLTKRDDILSFRDPVTGATETVNAGRTSHRGVELSARVRPWDWLEVQGAVSRARHEYDEWVVDPARGVDYSGKEMESAPRTTGSLLVTYLAGRHGSLALQVAQVGGYWLDADNTQRYDGHTLVNLHGRVHVGRRLALFGRVVNLADRRYAESGSYTQARGREFAPGQPRTFYGGLTVEWQR